MALGNPEHDALVAEVLARHFDGASVSGTEIDLAFGGLTISVEANRVEERDTFASANLFFRLRGGNLGATPVFVSISGYGTSAREALVTGTCNWACVFGPVLRAGLAGLPQPDVEEFNVVLHGQAFRAFIDGMDRVLTHGGKQPEIDSAADMRKRWGADPWLAPLVMDSGLLPVLPVNTATVLSVFASDMGPGRRVVEVKVNGRDWAGLDRVFAGAAPGAEGTVTMLRELVVLVPAKPVAPLLRQALVQTLAGAAEVSGGVPCLSTDWRGWRSHGARLAPPLTAEDLARLEGKVGPLPQDYRAFLAKVAGAGAGPGYGLLSPINDAQATLAQSLPAGRGRESDSERPAGVLALAHAGCGILWLLEVRGPHPGRVWLDSTPTDGELRVVSDSFDAWYREWLDVTSRGFGPWSQWDRRRCATPSVLSRYLESLEASGTALDKERPLAGRVGAGKLALKSGASPYFASGVALDPCHACVTLAATLGLDEAVFAPGVPALEPQPHPVTEAPSAPRPGASGASCTTGLRGWWQRLRQSVSPGQGGKD
jgi:hypothetical protein